MVPTFRKQRLQIFEMILQRMTSQKMNKKIPCAESLLYNKNVLKRLVIADGVILKQDVERNILDKGFWCGLLSLHEIIAPILKWITILEGDYNT